MAKVMLAGVMLRRWMDETRTTQTVLSKKLGVSQTAVSAWLAGSEPRATIASKLEELTKIPVAAWGQDSDESIRDLSAVAADAGDSVERPTSANDDARDTTVSLPPTDSSARNTG